MPQPLYSMQRAPQYPLDRRLGGPQSWYGHHREVKILLPLLGIESQSPSCPANNLVAIKSRALVLVATAVVVLVVVVVAVVTTVILNSVKTLNLKE
jgi:hypothetical protein